MRKIAGTFKERKGFTLIELAIVLIIIGLILGMVFKAKHLIDGAKVKHLGAQYNKILAAINTFYDRYGRYPGDGCNDATCSNNGAGTKDGVLTTAAEEAAFWYELIDKTGILTRNDRRSVFGQNWNIWYGTGNDGVTGDWLDLPGGNQADSRFVCALDQLIDDGRADGGVVQPYNAPNLYDENSDCWALTGLCNVIIRVIP